MQNRENYEYWCCSSWGFVQVSDGTNCFLLKSWRMEGNWYNNKTDLSGWDVWFGSYSDHNLCDYLEGHWIEKTKTIITNPCRIPNWTVFSQNKNVKNCKAASNNFAIANTPSLQIHNRFWATRYCKIYHFRTVLQHWKDLLQFDSSYFSQATKCQRDKEYSKQ